MEIHRRMTSDTSALEFRIGDTADVEAFLAERIYEFNAAATGYHDGESFTATYAGESGAVEAGLCGYTWGGCCFVLYLWVAQALRGKGLGSQLLAAAELHARAKQCRLVLVSSHSFQAPRFYARKGYEQIAVVNDHRVGDQNIFFAKRLDKQ